MGKRLERAQSKAVLSASLAGTGAAIAGPVGAGVGAITGLIVGDEPIVFPIDMIAIPAFQYSALVGNGVPSFSIYIKEGEVLTQVMATDAEEAAEQMALDSMSTVDVADRPPKRRKTKYQRAYKKAFDSLKPDYVKANGQWKKGGFKRCVKAAHKKAKEMM